MFEISIILFIAGLLAILGHAIAEAKAWTMYTSFSSDQIITFKDEWRLPTSMAWLDRSSAVMLTTALISATLLV